MGAGGGLWAQYNIAFGPRQFFFAQTFAVLAMIVVGGLASVSGAVIGATVVTAASETLRRIEDGGADVGPLHIPGANGMTSIALALLILIVLRWRRDGLVGLFEIDDALARRRSRRAEVKAHERLSAVSLAGQPVVDVHCHGWRTDELLELEPSGFLDRITMMGMCLISSELLDAAARRAPAAADGLDAAGEPDAPAPGRAPRRRADPRGRRRGAPGRRCASRARRTCRACGRTPGWPRSWSTRAIRSRRSRRPSCRPRPGCRCTAWRASSRGSTGCKHDAASFDELEDAFVRRGRAGAERAAPSPSSRSSPTAPASTCGRGAGATPTPRSQRWREDGWAESREHAKPVRDNLLRRTFEIAAAANWSPRC